MEPLLLLSRAEANATTEGFANPMADRSSQEEHEKQQEGSLNRPRLSVWTEEWFAFQ